MLFLPVHLISISQCSMLPCFSSSRRHFVSRPQPRISENTATKNRCVGILLFKRFERIGLKHSRHKTPTYPVYPNKTHKKPMVPQPCSLFLILVRIDGIFCIIRTTRICMHKDVCLCIRKSYSPSTPLAPNKKTDMAHSRLSPPRIYRNNILRLSDPL